MRLFFGYFCCRSLYGFVDWNFKCGVDEIREGGRSLYGFVDWNCYFRCVVISGNFVEAYTASWIEITMPSRLRLRLFVEAYTASWIEIFFSDIAQLYPPSKPIRLRGLKSKKDGYKLLFFASKPIRLRGLKSIRLDLYPYASSRSLYGFVDWNMNRTGTPQLLLRRSLYGFVDWNCLIPSIKPLLV